MQQVSSSQLKRYLKHLCIVANHQYNREEAAKELHQALKDQNIEEINKKITLLLEKESKVAELGSSKKEPSELSEKLRLLEKQLEKAALKEHKLKSENKELKKAIETLATVKSTLKDIHTIKDKTSDRIDKLEKKVDKKYKQKVKNQVKDKLYLLEKSYKELDKDPSIDPRRLYLIKEKIDKYKKKIKSLR